MDKRLIIKNKIFCLLLVLFVFGSANGKNLRVSQALHLFENGEFAALQVLSDSLKMVPNGNLGQLLQTDSLLGIASRIKLDFSLSEPIAEAQIRTGIGNFTLESKNRWEQAGWLECRLIDGQKRYFNRAVDNLKLRLAQYNDSVAHRQPAIDSLMAFRLRNTAQVIANTARPGDLAQPGHHFTLTYTLSVKPDVVPAGETVRCWLPYPKENDVRQSNINLLSTSQKEYTISPDEAGPRSLYMEAKAVAGKPVDFSVKFSFTVAAQYFDLNKISIKSYKKNSELYRTYTAQQMPHIVFSHHIKALADKIVGKEKRPKEVVQRLYEWIDSHIIWSDALEYSTMPNIPEYVLEHRRGDSGMKTLLFMSMARYKGIPVKWQSGWMLQPDAVNMHDWCEVYYEGVGWVPLDMSFGLQPDDNHAVRYFYMNGIDGYRWIVNDAIQTPLIPLKKYLRSETVDFQRGEVEWNGGNLYFDKWNYHVDVSYE